MGYVGVAFTPSDTVDDGWMVGGCGDSGEARLKYASGSFSVVGVDARLLAGVETQPSGNIASGLFMAQPVHVTHQSRVSTHPAVHRVGG